MLAVQMLNCNCSQSGGLLFCHLTCIMGLTNQDHSSFAMSLVVMLSWLAVAPTKRILRFKVILGLTALGQIWNSCKHNNKNLPATFFKKIV